jgi:hypothetical protein
MAKPEPINREPSRSWRWEGKKLQGYFAARFQAYRTSKPNQLIMGIKTDVVVEVFQATAERWEARTRAHGSDRLPKRFTVLKDVRCGDLGQAFRTVEQLFYNRVGDWQLYSAAGLIIEPEEDK